MAIAHDFEIDRDVPLRKLFYVTNDPELEDAKSSK